MRNSDLRDLPAKRWWSRQWLPWILLPILGLLCILLVPFLSEIDLSTDLSQKPAPDWSRGLRIGQTSDEVGGATLAADQQDHIHIIWRVPSGVQERDLHYVHLDEQGKKVAERNLETGLHWPGLSRVLVDREGRVHVFTLARPEVGAPQVLYHLLLTSEGRLSAPPTMLSSSSEYVLYPYDLVADANGRIHIFWSQKGVEGSNLYYSTLATDGERFSMASPRLLIPGGWHPACGIDGDGKIHLIWLEQGEESGEGGVYYVALSDPIPESVSGLRILEWTENEGDEVWGPVLGLDQEYAYIIWTGGHSYGRISSGSSIGWYVGVPLLDPQPVPAVKISLPLEDEPSYLPHRAPYGYRYMAPLPLEGSPASGFLSMPYALADQAEESPVVFSLKVDHGKAGKIQIALVIFADGQISGYQLVGKTAHLSRRPRLIADSKGNLHLSWVEFTGSIPTDVYYASTSPLVKAQLDRLTSDDLILGLFNAAFGMSSAWLFIPLAIPWLIPPLICMAIASRLVGEEGVQVRRGKIALALTLILYMSTKVLLAPSLLTHVPFSDWIPFIPPLLSALLKIGVLSSITALSIIILIYFIRYRDIRSLLGASFAFMTPDFLLTLSIYGSALAGMS